MKAVAAGGSSKTGMPAAHALGIRAAGMKYRDLGWLRSRRRSS
jgi:hypothetical protein